MHRFNSEPQLVKTLKVNHTACGGQKILYLSTNITTTCGKLLYYENLSEGNKSKFLPGYNLQESLWLLVGG